jgi:hypothetical protein
VKRRRRGVDQAAQRKGHAGGGQGLAHGRKRADVDDHRGEVWSFWRILDSLAGGAAPFLTGFQVRGFSPSLDDEARSAYLNSELKLTGLGMTALLGKKDALEFRRLDRWMGGTHLTNKTCWRWDAGKRALTRPNGRA